MIALAAGAIVLRTFGGLTDRAVLTSAAFFAGFAFDANALTATSTGCDREEPHKAEDRDAACHRGLEVVVHDRTA